MNSGKDLKKSIQSVKYEERNGCSSVRFATFVECILQVPLVTLLTAVGILRTQTAIA